MSNYIYIGDTVTCINDYRCNLTYGKKYKIKNKSYNLISITNDVGKTVEYRKDRFELYNPNKLTPEPVKEKEDVYYNILSNGLNAGPFHTLDEAKNHLPNQTQYITQVIMYPSRVVTTTTTFLPFCKKVVFSD